MVPLSGLLKDIHGPPGAIMTSKYMVGKWERKKRQYGSCVVDRGKGSEEWADDGGPLAT